MTKSIWKPTSATTRKIQSALDARERPRYWLKGGEAHWTWEDLARATGMQSSHLYRSKGNSWGFKTLAKIEAVLSEDVRPGELLALWAREQNWGQWPSRRTDSDTDTTGE
jgi:hypothetical protein